jgi:hypothetical protein
MEFDLGPICLFAAVTSVERLDRRPWACPGTMMTIIHQEVCRLDEPSSSSLTAEFQGIASPSELGFLTIGIGGRWPKKFEMIAIVLASCFCLIKEGRRGSGREDGGPKT